jgi:predicted DCC family thiol-disulfide oxidoreductase YuxK
VTEREPVHVIYDGQCDFCVRALRVARALDVFGRLRFHDAHDRQAIEAAFPALAGADLDEAMYSVTARGAIDRGFFAFRRMMRLSPLTWPLLLLVYLPGAGLIGPRIYTWIARNRHRFGCRSQICTRPEEGGPTVAAGSSRRDRA